MPSKRQLQVGELLRRNFSQVFIEKGSYIYGDVLVTVTSVVVTPDLAEAKIYLSIYGTEQKQVILNKIIRNAKNIKKDVAHRIRRHVRRIPVFSYYIDETVDEMYRVEELFVNLNESE